MQMKKKNQEGVDLGTDEVRGLLLKLALPAILAQVINVLYNMVDRIYIGHIQEVGAAALTGVGVTMPLILCVSAFAALVSMGGAPRASIMMGRGEKAVAEKILGNCTTMLLVVAVVITVLLQLFGRPILLVFGASENTIAYAWDYMRIYSLGTIAVQLALGLNAFINAQGFAKIGMKTVLIGAVCNIILDPIFIFGFHMGVKGAALATVLSQTVSCVWILVFLFGKKATLQLKPHNLLVERNIIVPCLALGLSPFIMQFTESLLIICFNTSLLNYGGDVAVGAMTILASVMQIVMLPLQGLSQGAQPIISYNFGAKKFDRVKQTFRLELLFCMLFTAVLWLLCLIAPQLLIRLFTSDAALTAYATWSMRVYMGASVLMGAQIACQQTFIALGNAKISIFLALLRKVILLIPLIYVLPLLLQNQVLAVYLAEPIADVIAVATTCVLFSRQYKRLQGSMGGRR